MKIMNKLLIMTIFATCSGSTTWAMEQEKTELSDIEKLPAEINVEILEQMTKDIKDFDSLKEILKTFGSLAQTSRSFGQLLDTHKQRLAQVIRSQIDTIIDTTEIGEAEILSVIIEAQNKGITINQEEAINNIIYNKLFSLADKVESPILIELLKQKILEPIAPPFLSSRTPDNLEFLFTKGIDPSIKNEQGETILNLLIEEGNQLASSWLIDYIEKKLGSNVKKYINTPHDEGYTPLHSAAFGIKGIDDKGKEIELNEEIVKSLLEKGADIYTKDSAGHTPLHHAAENNSIEIANLFIQHAGGNVKEYVNTPDNEGLTALHIAMLNDEPEELVTLLLKSGADPYKKDSGEETPLHAAFPEYEEEEGEEEISIDSSLGKDATQLVLDHIKKSGGDVKKYVNEIDDEGHIPLHHAAMAGATEGAQLLIQAGSNLHALDKENKKPIDLAKNYEMKQLLEKAMKEKPEEKSSRN